MYQVKFWDNQNTGWKTEDDIVAGMRNYAKHVAPVLARQGRHTRKEFEFGKVDRFIHAQVGPVVHRFAFVSLYKRRAEDRTHAWITLDADNLLGDNDGDASAGLVEFRVIDIDSIHGNVLLYPIPPPSNNPTRNWLSATPFIKN